MKRKKEGKRRKPLSQVRWAVQAPDCLTKYAKLFGAPNLPANGLRCICSQVPNLLRSLRRVAHGPKSYRSLFGLENLPIVPSGSICQKVLRFLKLTGPCIPPTLHALSNRGSIAE